MDRVNYVHFIGIGGVSMSAIAKVLIHNGIKVSGSDRNVTKSTKELEAMGATVFASHCAENIKNPDLVVYTAAIKDDNEELKMAKEKGIKTITRAKMLGEIMKNYSRAISVAGTHGKTTATSMLAYVLMKASLDPTIMVGGEIDIIDGNFRQGKSDYFITESCEYCRSFLSFFPTVAIVLNVDSDHLDYYKDLDDIKDAFRDFVALVPKDGVLVVCADCENTMDCLKKAQAKPITYGINSGEYRATSISFDNFGYPTFTIEQDGEKLATLTLNVVGKHNVLNATGIFAAADNMGIDKKFIIEGLEAFKGTKRRFEKKGYANGALVIDDYAHHPAEIEATQRAIGQMKHNASWCIFQPHTYTRTKALFDDFASVLSGFDNVVITDIYAAREKDTGLVSAKQLAEKIDNAVYIKEFEEIAKYIKENVKENDIVITMGAGNVVDICDMIKDS